MLDRPYTLLSCALSIDGYLDTATPRRLELSNDADFDRVDSVRASCDAILVGAATVRNDNPRLLVRSRARRDERTARGLAPSPIKITVTERVELDACSDFFTTGDTEKLVYCASPRVVDARSRLGPVATVVDAGQPVEMRRISEDLGTRGVQRLMVEGGGTVHTQFLIDDLAIHLAGRPTNPDAFVFTSPRGEVINHKNFYRRSFKPAVRAAGLPATLRFYDLRHTAASLLIR